MTTEQKTDAGRYQPANFEARWRERWERDGLYRTPDHVPGRENRYHLTMFPYPSGDLHVGHWFAMAPSDALARFYQMRGWNVLFPMGFDAFGLPAENAAIKSGHHPQDWTNANIERMRQQLRAMGASFDWEREVNSSAPDYYRWTQWFFVQLFNRGLAYRKRATANWCPDCNTTLANEQVVDGRCERSDTIVVQREMEQWFFRITAYAEELLDNEHLDWPEHVKVMQRNWIGRSEGAEFTMQIQGRDDLPGFRVFTTRPDTSFGMTFAVLAPEHELVDQIVTPEQRAAVDEFVERVRRTTEIDRLSTEGPVDKRGVFTGAYAINPFTQQPVPIYLADYVLTSYGTGAIMAVPGEDERDWDFAKAYGLPIVRTVAAARGLAGGPPVHGGRRRDQQRVAQRAREGRRDRARHLVAGGAGDRRAEGELPPARLADLAPALLGRSDPDRPLRAVRPRGRPGGPAAGHAAIRRAVPANGQSPLALSEEFVATSCPQCGAAARRETDTMDTFVCSSWYFMRYPDPRTRRRRSGARSRTRGCRWTSTRAAPSTRRCTCCTRASSTRSRGTWASCPATSRSPATSHRGRSWGRTAGGCPSRGGTWSRRTTRWSAGARTRSAPT
jgi:leucyl-tRNA synthetase